MKSESFNEIIVDSIEEKKASVPFMITREMKQQLADLGWGEDVQNSLTPEDANLIINSLRMYEKGSNKTQKAKESFGGNLSLETTVPSQESAALIENQIKNTHESLTNIQEKIKFLEGQLGIPHGNEDPPSVKFLKEKLDGLHSKLKDSKQTEERHSSQEENYVESESSQGVLPQESAEDNKRKKRRWFT